MVVVPTSTHVELHYGYSGVDKVGYLATFIGLVGIVLFLRRRAPGYPSAAEVEASEAAESEEPPGPYDGDVDGDGTGLPDGAPPPEPVTARTSPEP
jgi:hypothetical protein